MTVKRKSSELVYSPLYDISEYTSVLAAEKYKLLYDELKFQKWNWHEPKPADEKTLALAHTKKYLADFLGARVTDKTRRLGERQFACEIDRIWSFARNRADISDFVRVAAAGQDDAQRPRLQPSRKLYPRLGPPHLIVELRKSV